MIQRLLRVRFQDARNETIWLTIYADLITNLALVFLALYGLTIMGDDAITKAIHSMKLEEIYVLNEAGPDVEFNDVTLILKKRIPQTPNLLITEEAGAVRLSFGDEVLFDSGQAALKTSAKTQLLELARVLKGLPLIAVVEGHTDNVPLRVSSSYESNWELSLARAMSIVRVLISEGKMPAAQLAAAAYGENKPRASNATASGRRINRRVEIALFRSFPYGDSAPLKSDAAVESTDGGGPK